MAIGKRTFLSPGRYVNPIIIHLNMKYSCASMIVIYVFGLQVGSNVCVNLDCNGFVPVNGAPITPGDTLESPKGKIKITFKIFKVRYHSKCRNYKQSFLSLELFYSHFALALPLRVSLL